MVLYNIASNPFANLVVLPGQLDELPKTPRHQNDQPHRSNELVVSVQLLALERRYH